MRGGSTSVNLADMRIHQIRRRIERRQALGSAGRPLSATRSQAVLYDRSLDVAEAAQELERVAAADGGEGAVPAALGCATSTFESLANSMLMMRGLVLRAREGEGATPEAERLARLLYAIDQNLRFAAHAADLGCRQAQNDAAPAGQALAG